MDKPLIFDIGMHKGQDTAYYLAKGYRVVAVDADVRLIEEARVAFANAVNAGQLTLVNCAVAPEEGEVEFHLSEESAWNSLNKNISSRGNLSVTSVKVPARRLANLMAEYGVPEYCKIDVEGYDSACLTTLEGSRELPRFISVESECVGDEERLTEAQALETLDGLNKLGYRQFKLVDQSSLAVLSPAVSIYRSRPSLGRRLINRLGWKDNQPYNYGGFVDMTRKLVLQKHGYPFPEGASGPFGEDLAGDWLDYPAARSMLLRHRDSYYRMPTSSPHGFWCDWHATGAR